MGLFGRDKPVVFDPYGSRRRRPKVPGWLILLVVGVALGALGLFYVQENHLPPRLTPEKSRELIQRVEALEAERRELRESLDKANEKASAATAESGRIGETARTDRQKLSADLAAARQLADRLQAELALFDQIIPPDPRGGAIAVRAGRFSNEAGQLDYHVLLGREARGGRAFQGVMELVVTGVRGGERTDTITLEPIAVTLSGLSHLRGRLALPAGFEARQITIRVLDAPDGQMLGTRIYNVR
jgi:hypothetical protein